MKKNQKTCKIFLNSLNSWLSNFIIEAFRTDYLENPPIQNEFMGTLNASPIPLPRLFEPKIIKINPNYDYNQEIFQNDIFIFNLNDSNLDEVEFVIRGLKNIKYLNEKVLILISNIMTWANTPLKTFSEEEMKKFEFNEEEFIQGEIILDEDPKPKVIFVKKEEEKKEEENNEKNTKLEKEKTTKKRGKSGKKKQAKKDKKSASKKKKGKKEEKKEEDKKSSENPSDTDSKPIESQSNKNEISPQTITNTQQQLPIDNNLLNQDDSEPKPHIFYYKQNEYQKRVPNRHYFQYKLIETEALNNSNPMLKVYIICPGFIYGCGEDFFYDYFRDCFLSKSLDILGSGLNSLPTIHIKDLVNLLKKIIETKPILRYILAIDRTKNPCMKNILKSISKCVGDGKVHTLNNFDMNNFDLKNFLELNIDIKIKTPPILLNNFNWHCEYGIPENYEKIRNEFFLYRNLKIHKIFIIGPPTCGKTYLAQYLSKEYKIPVYNIKDIIEWGKNLDNDLGIEIRKTFFELEEKIPIFEEEYEKRKNKKKTDPPFNKDLFIRLNDILLCKIIKEKLKSEEIKAKGYIFEGFPKKYFDNVEIFSEIEREEVVIEDEKNKKKKKNEEEKKEIVIKNIKPLPELYPDHILYFDDYNEEILKNYIESIDNYSENQEEINMRFQRRFELFNTNNSEKKISDYFDENNLKYYKINTDNFYNNFKNEILKIKEYLNRNGEINNLEKLTDEDYVISIKEEEKNYEENFNYNEINESFEIENNEFKQKIIENDTKKFFDIKEEIKIIEPNEKNLNDTISSKNLSEKQSEKNLISNNNNNNKEFNFEEETKKIEENEKIVLNKIKELKEREKKLLEKKSEVVRRYLNENILPLLAKGILKICEKLPDDPVESLANFLLENRFEKKLTEKLENNNKNNFENNNINFNEDTLKIEGEDFIEQKSEHNVENDIDL